MSFISMFRETTDNGYDDECGNKVHLLCDSLDSKTVRHLSIISIKHKVKCQFMCLIYLYI